MYSLTYITFLVGCFVVSSAVEVQEETSAAPEVDPYRYLREVGYFQYQRPYYRYPIQKPQDPTETNEITSGEEDRRPLFIFTYDPVKVSKENVNVRPVLQIRKKREAEMVVPEESKIGKLRRKRTYCRKCGGGGYGGAYYAIPVYVSTYPVYTHGGGGGGGCNTCGGGKYYGGGGGGGGGFSYSHSSSSSSSSSGSFGYGK